MNDLANCILKISIYLIYLFVWLFVCLFYRTIVWPRLILVLMNFDAFGWQINSSLV